jgi:hypothetical protein
MSETTTVNINPEKEVVISKDDLSKLHAIAAAGGSVLEKSLTREAAILILGQLGLDKPEVIGVLDRTAKLFGLVMHSREELKETDKFINEIEDIVEQAYGKKN